MAVSLVDRNTTLVGTGNVTSEVTLRTISVPTNTLDSTGALEFWMVGRSRHQTLNSTFTFRLRNGGTQVITGALQTATASRYQWWRTQTLGLWIVNRNSVSVNWVYGGFDAQTTAVSTAGADGDNTLEQWNIAWWTLERSIDFSSAQTFTLTVQWSTSPGAGNGWDMIESTVRAYT